VVPFLLRTRSLVLIAQPVKVETTALVEKADPLVKFAKVEREHLAEREEIARRFHVLMSSRKTKDLFRSQSALMNDDPEVVDPATKTRREVLERATGVRLDLNSKVLNPSLIPLSKMRRPPVRLRLKILRRKLPKSLRF
jgi:hypothetical protein